MRGVRRATVKLKEIPIDYKDLDALKPFIGETGKIIPGRISGASARFQRNITREIKILITYQFKVIFIINFVPLVHALCLSSKTHTHTHSLDPSLANL